MPRGQAKNAKNGRRKTTTSRAQAKRTSGATVEAGRKATGRKAGKAPDYERMSRSELYDKARQVGIQGRSHMKKRELIDALRSH